MPTQKRPGKIFTFYSYKGGTGRSMALANMAWVLASNGKRVLIIDWDLEAPGLHRFIHPFLEDKSLSTSTGVIDFVLDFSAEAMTPPKDPEVPLPDDWYKPHANILRHAVPLNWKSFRKPGALHFIPAGKQDAAYAKRVNAFNWQKFYEVFGGFRFLEAAKEKMKSEYDYVLIDSRTGVSDTSGICTVQLPDALVVCFTLNSQSIEGARSVAGSVDEQRRTSSGASGLRIYPVPTRVETGEKEKLELARTEAWDKFSQFLWHVGDDEHSRYWGQVEILYQPFYAYEEVLATFGDKPDQTNSVLASIERLTGYVTEGDVVKLVPPDEQERRAVIFQYARRKQTPEPIGDESSGNEFWFYMSYAGTDFDENVERFYRDLSAEVRRLQGLKEDIIGCLPRRSLSLDMDEPDRAEQALMNSRVLVPLYSPSYFANEQCAKELNFFALLSEGQPDEPRLDHENGMHILPVSWIPSGPLPSTVDKYGLPLEGELRDYPKEGLFYLMRLQRHYDDYQAFVVHFARALIKQAEIRTSRPIVPRTSLRDSPASFGDSEPGAVYISYAPEDRKAARSIAEMLSREEQLPVHDIYSLPTGESLLHALDDKIRKSSSVLILIGAGGIRGWQKREINVALQLQGQEGSRAPRTIPVLLPGATPQMIQGFLSLYTWIDLRKGLDDVALARVSRAVCGETPPQLQFPEYLCPYPGLKSFSEEEAPVFHGREVLVEQLDQKLKSVNVVTLIGPAGSGKSSVVNAGLLPLLRRSPKPVWEALVVTPGTHPFFSLATGLLTLRRGEITETSVLNEADRLSDGLAKGFVSIDVAGRAVLKELGADRLLIVVDQFEDIFTLTTDKEARHAFASMIFGLPNDSPVTVLIACRAEFYDRLLGLGSAVTDRFVEGVMTVGPMSRDELRRAIENSAQMVGLRFQPGLVERILDDLKDQPGNLPSLQAALVELYKNREGNLLTHKAYQEIGDIEGAITRIAETLFERLLPSEHDAALRVLTRMVRIPSEPDAGMLAREAVKLSELNEAELAVVSQLTNLKLVRVVRSASGGAWAELAHDAFLNWQRLITFIKEDRKFLLWHQNLRDKVSDWERAGRSSGTLLNESEAREADLYLRQRGTELSDSERAYIKSSSDLTRKFLQRRRLSVLGTVAATAVIASSLVYWQLGTRITSSEVLLAGRVLDKSSQRPISNARVRLDTEGSSHIIYTDSNGVFLLKLPKSTEPVKAHVNAESYQSLVTMLQVSEVITILLSPVASIQITKLPTFGGGGPSLLTSIEGHITYPNPEDFRVVIYAYTNMWYVQPDTASPLIDINADGRWSAQIHQGMSYAVLLVRSGFTPPSKTDISPAELGGEIVDSRILKPNQ